MKWYYDVVRDNVEMVPFWAILYLILAYFGFAPWDQLFGMMTRMLFIYMPLFEAIRLGVRALYAHITRKPNL